MTNIFADAPEAPKNEKKPSSKKELQEVALPVEKHAAIKYIIKSLEGLAKLEEGVIEAMALEIFMGNYAGLFKSGHPKKPDNMKGVEGGAVTTITFNKKSTKTTLTDQEVELLQQAEIRLGEEKDEEERFVFDSEVLMRPGVAAAVSEAIQKIPGTEGLVKKTTAKTRYYVSDETIEDLFKKAPETVKELFPYTHSISLKPTIDNPKTVTRVLTEAIEGKPANKKGEK